MIHYHFRMEKCLELVGYGCGRELTYTWARGNQTGGVSSVRSAVGE